MPSVALAGIGTRAAIFAAAAGRAGWDVTSVAGDSPQPLADETGARVVSLAELLAEPGADMVVVDTSSDVRGRHAIGLLDSGVHVVVAPGIGADVAELLVGAERRSPASLVIAEIFPTAPTVQRWFTELDHLVGVTHLSGRAKAIDGDWSLLIATALSARLAGWGAPVEATGDGAAATLHFASGGSIARLSIDIADDRSAPQWELQAANSTSALRIEMLPRQGLERNGSPVAVPASTDPAETFGAAPFLRMFWSDIETGRKPVLDAAFLLTIERLRDQLSRAR